MRLGQDFFVGRRVSKSVQDSRTHKRGNFRLIKCSSGSDYEEIEKFRKHTQGKLQNMSTIHGETTV